ncbi:MAG: ABC transporter permease [Caldilineaceae bacterium]|nr:ABC transporter permease [Caldilineaceae bacterium]
MAQQVVSPTTQETAATGNAADEQIDRSVRLLTHRQLVLMRFRKNRLALMGLVFLVALYLVTIFCEFLAPYEPNRRFQGYVHIPPSRIHIRTTDGQWRMPFIYKMERKTDTSTFERTYVEDTSTPYPIRLFVRGDRYRMWGVFANDLHLFGVDAEAGPIALLGGDAMGRDLLSRVLYGGRISLSVPLVGVVLSLIIGLVLGGVSGYYGGVVDNIVQRVIELIRSIPTIPLWMGLAAALPPSWPQLRIYVAITIILSFVGWTTLARVIRGKFLALREEDYVMAAVQAGAKPSFVIREHLIPAFASYILVHLTLTIPGLIIGETSLSFLGLGLVPPTISWGVLLKDAQKVQEVALHPWILTPAIFVLVTVMAFNFLGDGLRDAADPYTQRT